MVKLRKTKKKREKNQKTVVRHYGGQVCSVFQCHQGSSGEPAGSRSFKMSPFVLRCCSTGERNTNIREEIYGA